MLALADTLSSCKINLSGRFTAEGGSLTHRKRLLGIKEFTDTSVDFLDDCGLRFLLAMKHYNYLQRCLPISQRSQSQRAGIGTNNIVWAFHSESQEELLNLVPSYSKGELKWSTLKELGVGWWIQNISLMRQCFERLAKAAYQIKQDPLDAAIYYCALKKKSVIWGLFRSKKDEKMTAFFANDFTEERWRKAALKNAYALLGKQRFEHAVAFFLLAGSLKDALEVCLTKLEDVQLALSIARLFENSQHQTCFTYKQLLREQVLGYNDNNDEIEKNRTLSDPFLRSVAFWILKDYVSSLNTLLNVCKTGIGSDERFVDTGDATGSKSSVFNFYIYLRSHPLLILQQKVETAQKDKSNSTTNLNLALNEKSQISKTIMTPPERHLYFRTAYDHLKAGCPALALDVLLKLPTARKNQDNCSTIFKQDERKNKINEGNYEFQEISKTNMPTENNIDWSAPTETMLNEEGFKIVWDEEENAKVSLEDELKENEPNPRNSEEVDEMGQQFKFIACIRILMEELITFTTGFDLDGKQLRIYFYSWLEKGVEALKAISYLSSELKYIDEYTNQNQEEKLETKQSHDTTPFRRIMWIKSNEHFIRTLLNYCSLNCVGTCNLASIRMELIFLLQELQKERYSDHFNTILSPVPPPLISSCIANIKTVVSG